MNPTELRIIKSPVVNQNARPPGTKIIGVVLHCTTRGKLPTWRDALMGSISWWNNPASEASAHIIIDRDGTVYETVPDSRNAWHAGVTDKPFPDWLPPGCNPNHWTLGVELLGDVGDYTEIQYEVAALWIRCKATKFVFPLANICAHSDLYSQRSDPGPQAMAEIRGRL